MTSTATPNQYPHFELIDSDEEELLELNAPPEAFEIHVGEQLPPPVTISTTEAFRSIPPLISPSEARKMTTTSPPRRHQTYARGWAPRGRRHEQPGGRWVPYIGKLYVWTVDFMPCHGFIQRCSTWKLRPYTTIFSSKNYLTYRLFVHVIIIAVLCILNFIIY